MTTITTLVERFSVQIDSYLQKSSYNETQTRLEFINPFFIALGWDVTNERGYAEAYKDVVHEDALKIGRATKAPDYSFRIGGVRKFFLEAKKPSVSLKDNAEAAFQVRRYGWSAKLPLSLLMNFAELAVYDCRIKPAKNDSAAIGRILYLTYTEYVERWDEISGVFSRDAILKGAFDKYIESQTSKKGTATVDTAFLAEIERWRDSLARNLALRNSDLTQRELNFAVQQTIDRLIFLRICEDRGIEDYGRLLALRHGSDIYPRLFQLFQQADQRYNSGLFHFQAEKQRDNPDTLTETLVIDDQVLTEILKNLYYPDSPYEFSVLPADILGQVYEQFLGKVIRLTPAHRAVVEPKPEVKKAGGVYYTPTYIVDYIVKQTIGSLVEQKTPTKVSRLKILDPACGSGSFLLGAYQFLLDWHQQYYRQNPTKWAKGKNPRLFQTSGDDWQLTIAERKRILLNNIYGVDIDSQAVEVTKLSLLLKVLENEQHLFPQLSLFKERVLPNLDNNIKSGNSLIGSDFYQQQLGLLDEETLYQINAFDWNTEFADVMKAGGFDAVIGNPPYVRQELLGDWKSYFQEHYRTYHGVADLYVYFIEKGISLLRDNGYFGIIVANKWMRANYGKPLRQWLKQQHLTEITDFGDLPVFQQATTYPCILGIQKGMAQTTFQATQVKTLDFADLKTYTAQKSYTVQQTSLNDTGWTLLHKKSQALLDKLHQMGVPLTEYVNGNIYRGVLTGLNDAFVIDAQTRERLIAEDAKSEELIKPFLLGREVKRYQPPFSKHYLIFIPKGWTNFNLNATKNAWAWFTQHYPSIAAHLKAYSEKAQKRYDKGEYWWELRACDYYEEFEKPKIIIPAIVQKASYTFDDLGFYSNDKTSIIVTNDLYLLGLLNSKALDFVLHSIASTKQGGYFEYKPMYVQQLPIRTIDFNNPTDKSNHHQIVKLVEQMLALHKQLAAANEPQTKTVLTRQIEATDQKIDELVFRLYGLTAEEIEIVEKSRS
jgi:hypothetical protein